MHSLFLYFLKVSFILIVLICFFSLFSLNGFHIFDKDDNGSISLQEFIDAMHQFAGQSPDDKIKFLFKVYDIDGKFTLKKSQHVHYISRLFHKKSGP